MKSQGLPTENIKGIIEVGGRPTMVAERYAQGSKDVVKLVNKKIIRVGNSKYLNKRSVADLMRIRDIMVKNKVWVNDLQFLIGEDGSIVISDPIAVKVGKAPSDKNLRMIDLLIKAALGQ